MIAIGIGCRKGCPAGDIVALVASTLAALPGSRRSADGMFSIRDKHGEPGLAAAAATLGLPLVFLEREALGAFADAARTVSPLVMASFGLPSVAETAALAGAGAGATLLVTRRSSRTASCAIAGSPP